MHAAASGNSTLGIPQSVGQDYVAADKGKKISSLPNKKIPDHKRHAVAKALMGNKSSYE